MFDVSDSTLSILRRVGAVVIAATAVVVWATMGSPEKSAEAYLSDIKSVMTGDRLNQSSADSAPQQTVVNGWTARDLLAVSARIDAANTRDDDRIGAELMLLILAVCWLAITSPRAPQRDAAGHGGREFRREPVGAPALGKAEAAMGGSLSTSSPGSGTTA